MRSKVDAFSLETLGKCQRVRRLHIARNPVLRRLTQAWVQIVNKKPADDGTSLVRMSQPVMTAALTYSAGPNEDHGIGMKSQHTPALADLPLVWLTLLQ